MSSTPARRRRLAVARTFPLARCPHCEAVLARVDFPAKHLDRCERLALAAMAAAPVPRGTIRTESRWQRLLRGLGIQSRGAVE